MINRVFIYSDEEAQKNGNYTTLGRLFLVLFGMMAVMLIVIFASVEIDFSFEGGAGFLLIIAMIALMLIYGFSWRKKYFARLSSFATDTENNVYTFLGQGYYLMFENSYSQVMYANSFGYRIKNHNGLRHQS